MTYITIYIIILLFILFFYVRNIDNFSTNALDMTQLLQDECNFNPKNFNITPGELYSKDDCVKDCKDQLSCDDDYCQAFCNDCKDERCPWNKFEIPPAMNIKVLPYNEMAKIIWRPNDEKQVTSYIIIVQKLSDKSSRRVSVLNNTDCTECSYDVTGLKNQVPYRISIRAKNSKGIGPYSNFETVTPVGPKKNYDVSGSILESDFEIQNKLKEKIGYDETSCGKSSKYLNNNHILSNDYQNLLDYINEI